MIIQICGKYNYHATSGTEGGPVRTPASPAGLFLGVGFAATAADLSAGKGGGGTAALVLEVGGNAAVDDGACGVGRGGFEVEGGLADLFAFEGEDWESCKLRVDGEGNSSNWGIGFFEGFEGGEEFSGMGGSEES